MAEVGAAVEDADRRALAGPAGVPGVGEPMRLGVEDAELLHAVGLRVANSCDWPNWSQDSEFRAARDRSAAERQGACPTPSGTPERG